MKAPLTGTGPIVTLASGQASPRYSGLCLNPGGYVYWFNFGDKTVMRVHK